MLQYGLASGLPPVWESVKVSWYVTIILELFPVISLSLVVRTNKQEVPSLLSSHTAYGVGLLIIGASFTVMTAVPDCACEQVVELASCTLTKSYVNVPIAVVGALTVTLFPEMVVTVG